MRGKICLGGQTLEVCAIWDEEAEQQTYIQEAATKAGRYPYLDQSCFIV